MSSPGPKFIGLVGFPEEGEYVPVDTRAEAILIRQGWTPPPTRSRVEELLDEVFHKDAHDHWLNHCMNRFGGRTPQELIENGESSDVEAYLNALADGVVL